jgi:hypothetical protein
LLTCTRVDPGLIFNIHRLHSFIERRIYCISIQTCVMAPLPRMCGSVWKCSGWCGLSFDAAGKIRYSIKNRRILWIFDGILGAVTTWGRADRLTIATTI